MSTKKTDPAVAEHIKRAMQQHVLDAVSASEEVCGLEETRNTLKIAQRLFSEAEEERQYEGASPPYLDELGDEPYVEDRERDFKGDSFNDRSHCPLKFVSGRRGES